MKSLLNRSEEKLVRNEQWLHLLYTLREDLLLEEVTKLAPRMVALTTSSLNPPAFPNPYLSRKPSPFADEDGVSLSDVAKLDTMVTVVDALNFLRGL